MNFGIERAFESGDLYTGILTLTFVLIVVVKLKFPKMFSGLLTSVFSNAFFLDFSNELKSSFNSFKGLFFLIQNLIFSLFFYQIYVLYSASGNKHNFYLFFIIFFGVTCFLIAHYLISLLIARVFNFVDVFKSIHIVKFTYLKIVSLAILPVLLFMLYGEIENTEFLRMFSIAFFAVLMLLRAVLVVFKNNKVLIENLFYFIVYLCTLEIAPLLLIYKIGVNK
jgi:hypothetical protein